MSDLGITIVGVEIAPFKDSGAVDPSGRVVVEKQLGGADELTIGYSVSFVLIGGAVRHIDDFSNEALAVKVAKEKAVEFDVPIEPYAWQYMAAAEAAVRLKNRTAAFRKTH
jgi:hypothetical protein